MNFTKEYIELCKNEKIQGLRPELQIQDNFDRKNIDQYNPDYVDYSEFKKGIFRYYRDNFYWLPTGDQLDEEIIKIVNSMEYEYKRYEFKYFKNPIPHSMGYIYSALVEWFVEDLINPLDSDWNGIEFRDSDNPLIAKISLLIKLLEE